MMRIDVKIAIIDAVKISFAIEEILDKTNMFFLCHWFRIIFLFRLDMIGI